MKINKTIPKSVALFLITASSHQAIAQNTFSRVYNILQTNCAASGCHGGTSPVDFSVDGTEADVYNAIVGVDAVNPVAAAKGNQLVTPGFPMRSFLLRKINGGYDKALRLHQAEGAVMPDSLQHLTDLDIEIIRQWILHGAGFNDTLVDIPLLTDYFNGKGMTGLQVPDSPEDEGVNGFQIRIGPIFMKPGEEVEYFKKADLNITGDIDVIRMNAIMNWQSHHFAIFNYKPSANYPDGFVKVVGAAEQIPIHLNGAEIGAWNVSRDVELPGGSAYKWKANTTLILDYHIRNYSQDSILKAETFINIYTEQPAAGNEEMFMHFQTFGGDILNPWILNIPNTGQPYKEEMHHYISGSSKVWNIWRVQGHTHKLGHDFDIYLRNPDGTRGQQIYEGTSNPDHTFVQGFYDYAHAPVRTFDPFLQVDMSHGLIYEATWINSTQDTVGFGLTTEDEMFAAYIQHTEAVTTSATSLPPSDETIHIYPNPFTDQFVISYQLDQPAEIEIELMDINGKKIKTLLHNSVKQAGKYNHTFHFGEELAMGAYFIRQTKDEQSTYKKIIHLK